MSATGPTTMGRTGDPSRSTPTLAALLALPAIDPAVHGALAAYVNAAEGAYAAGTLRALVWDARHFTARCAAQGCIAVPATPEIVAAYVDTHAGTCQRE